MPETKIDPLDWFAIIQRIGKGLCVPFLGAGANAKSEEEKYKYEGLPLGGDVALHLIETITKLKKSEIERDLADLKNIAVIKKLLEYPDYKGLARLGLQDLTRVAHLFRSKIDTEIFIELLKQFIPDTELAPSMLLETVARIPKFRLIITTNYDRLMEKALQEADEHPEVIVQRVRGFNEDEQEEVRQQMAKPGGRIVYKMHGTFLETKPAKNKTEVSHQEGANGTEERREDLASQLIIGEDDYIEFLTVIGKPQIGVPDPVKMLMVDSTLLFLGYGMDDWDFRTLHKGLIEGLTPNKRRKSFAIQKDPTDAMIRFWDKKHVQIYNMDLYDFAEELKEECRAAGLYKDLYQEPGGIE